MQEHQHVASWLGSDKKNDGIQQHPLSDWMSQALGVGTHWGCWDL